MMSEKAPRRVDATLRFLIVDKVHIHKDIGCEKQDQMRTIYLLGRKKDFPSFKNSIFSSICEINEKSKKKKTLRRGRNQ